MPRNFDEGLEQDLGFTIRGEEFKMVYVRPEVLAAWEQEEEDDEKKEDSSDDALKQLDERIMLFLPQNGDRERWQELRAREENPVTMGQLNDLLLWMVEVQAGRPTNPPLALASGPGKTARSSGAK